MKSAICKALCGNLLLLSLLYTPLVLAMEKSQPATQKTNGKKVAAVVASNATVILPLGQSRDTTLVFTLNNNSAQTLSLTSITSSQVEKIQWIPAPSNFWTMSPHQQLTLDGKVHYIQLIGLKQSISSGDELLFELGFSDSSHLLLVAKARSAYDQVHGH